MKHFCCLVALMLIVQALNGQDTIAAQKFSGFYYGSLDSVSSGRTNHIVVRLFLFDDSTYTYEIDGVFSWCKSHTFSGTGKWLVYREWVCLKPDTAEFGSTFLPIRYPMDHAQPEGKEAENLDHLSQAGYDRVLRVTVGPSGCPSIFFWIAWDCFKNNWRNNAVHKMDCP